MSLTLFIPRSNKLINTAQSNDTELPASVKMEVKATSFNLVFSLPSPAKPHLPVVSQCPPAAPHQTNSFQTLCHDFCSSGLCRWRGAVLRFILPDTSDTVSSSLHSLKPLLGRQSVYLLSLFFFKNTPIRTHAYPAPPTFIIH